MKKEQLNQGQVVLLIVLLTVIGLTIGLSLVARTITDVRISSQIEQSQRAFSAAEAGVETALQLGTSIGTSSGSLSLEGSEAQFIVSPLGGAVAVYLLPLTSVGQAQTIWLIEHTEEGALDESSASYPPDAPLDICWGETTGNVPALTVTILYQEGGNYKIAKAAYDPLASSRGNNFLPVATTEGNNCQGSYLYKQTISASSLGVASDSKLIALRLQPVYADTSMAVFPTSSLPVQGIEIISQGKTETNIVRRIRVTQSYQSLPEMFNFTYFGQR